MSDARKIRVWPWIVAVLIGLPVLYVASFGPFLWMANHGFIPSAMFATAEMAYAPMFWARWDSPDAIHKPVEWYARRWHPKRRILGHFVPRITP